MRNVIDFIWNGFVKIPGYLRAVILICIFFFILWWAIRLMFIILVKIYAYIIVRIFSYILYKKIQKNKTGRLIAIDAFYYNHLEKLEETIISKEFYSMSKFHKLAKWLFIIVTIVLSASIMINESKENDEAKFSHAITEHYIKVETKLATWLGYDIPVWIPVIEEETIPMIDNEKERNKVEEERSDEDEIQKFYCLNEDGYSGAKIRSDPKIDNSLPVTIVSGDVRLEYLNEDSLDEEGRIWYKVKTEDGYIGWISSRLVDEVAN